MSNAIKFGTLYMGGKAIGPRVRQYDYRRKVSVDIGDTVPGKEIRWVPVDGILVADRCLLTKISRLDLDDNGFGEQSGKKVIVDGKPALCRLLRTEVFSPLGNELDAWQKAVASDPAVWHKDPYNFWALEKGTYNDIGVSFTPENPPRNFEKIPIERRSEDLGFRPALEFLIPDEELNEAMIGTTVTVYIGPNWTKGQIIEVTDYDLILRDQCGRIVPNTGLDQYVRSIPAGRAKIICREGNDYISRRSV